MNQFRKAIFAALALALTSSVSLPAMAQDTAADSAKVLAKVNGVDITQRDLDMAAADLDPQFARLPEEQRRLAALAALIDIKALAAKAEADTIRKLFASSLGENAIHGSDSDENARIEGDFFFSSLERI